MRDPTTRLDARSTYEIEPMNKFFVANCAIVEYEIRPSNSVSFASQVDLTEVERVRRRAGGGRKPSYTAFVVKAVALALRDFPYANRRVCRKSWLPFSGRRLLTFHRRDVTVAVERDISGAESTAFMDVIRDADQVPMATIVDTLNALAASDKTTNKQWREFSAVINRFPLWLSALIIRLPWYFPGLWVKYRGGAVLISSPAKYGVDAILGTWPHPLGISFGLVKPRAVVRGEEIVACPTFTLTLNFDRRVMAGAPASRFFNRIVKVLESAETEMAPYWSPSDNAPSPAAG
jgi:pyruvate/2-oxoglutarate dehydrogenase complex dihydrolipoamide acyltransferase (E2) component